LRTALKITEKTVNELAYSIQRGAILIVCQSAEAKYLQDCLLSASRFSAFLFDRNGVTGRSGSTGATEHKAQLIVVIVERVHILPSLRLSVVEQCEVFLLRLSLPVRASRTADAEQMA
jgi:hypothetical protein